MKKEITGGEDWEYRFKHSGYNQAIDDVLSLLDQHEGDAHKEDKKQVWTMERVKELNQRQRNGTLHPYTCRQRSNHPLFDGDYGVLMATIYGWICPFCDYTQGWAHETNPLAPRKEYAMSEQENHIGYARYRNGDEEIQWLELCNSDDKGAFKIYRLPRWIPVSERLPEGGWLVLGLRKNGEVVVIKFIQPDLIEFVGMGMPPAADIVYWQPLPPPPEGETK